MSANEIQSTIEGVATAVAEGLRAARARGIVCGPAKDVVITNVEFLCMDGSPSVDLKSLTLSSIDLPEE